MRSSDIFLVSVVTSVRSPTSVRARISFIRSSIWVLVSRTSTSGSTIPVGRTICSTSRSERVRYLHSEVDTLDRIQIIRELRLGEFDVLVGVNLLREGLDLPEVSLVAILDADKEGFLRGETSLIQTIGRAARNVNGRVIMYADRESAAMRTALGETNRRRAIQVAYNEQHGITPATISKGISDISEFLTGAESKVPAGRRRKRTADEEGMSAEQIARTLIELEEEMLAAAEELRFEYAAKLRDEIKGLRRELDALEAGA